MESNLTHEQSLTLINEMINRARNNVQKGRMYSMIYWGYTTAAIAILNYILLHVLNNPNHSFWAWCLMFPAGIVSYFIDRYINQKVLVKTHIDKIGDMVWKGYTIGVIVFLATIFVAAFRHQTPIMFVLTTPIILIMVGICEFTSAWIYRYKPWFVVAALFWVGAIGCAFLRADYHFFVLAVCMILGFVVPGHILNYQAKKSHV